MEDLREARLRSFPSETLPQFLSRALIWATTRRTEATKAYLMLNSSELEVILEFPMSETKQVKVSLKNQDRF